MLLLSLTISSIWPWSSRYEVLLLSGVEGVVRGENRWIEGSKGCRDSRICRKDRDGRDNRVSKSNRCSSRGSNGRWSRNSEGSRGRNSIMNGIIIPLIILIIVTTIFHLQYQLILIW